MSNPVIGDIVRLKSGGPKMTLSFVDTKTGEASAICFIQEKGDFIAVNAHVSGFVLDYPKEHIIASVDITGLREKVSAAIREHKSRL